MFRPHLTTHRALVVLDSPFDFPKSSAEYVKNIRLLVPKFRRDGCIIWAFDRGDLLLEAVDSAQAVSRPTEDLSQRPSRNNKHGLILSEERERLSSPKSSREAHRTQTEKHLSANVTSLMLDKIRDKVIDKKAGSAFQNPQLQMHLHRNIVIHLFLCGSSSIYETALEAGRYGFSVTIITDCVGSYKEEKMDKRSSY